MKIDIHNTDFEELVNPRSGHVGLLESRKAMKSLYDSPKWENPKNRTSKPKKAVVSRAYNTRKVGEEAYKALLESEMLS